jgi:antitoxin VapB
MEAAMNAVNGKIFKSGNSLAVRLPKEIAFAAGTDVVVERTGDVVTIRPRHDPAEEKRKLLELVAALRALGPADEIEKREPPMPPIRRGL